MKFYTDGGQQYLELHDHHTIWNINKRFSLNDYADAICFARLDMQSYFKDLKVYYLGRSGRHVCVDDTPVNRGRYHVLVEYAKKMEQTVIDFFNNEYEFEPEEEE
jgi:hypothetical protein